MTLSVLTLIHSKNQKCRKILSSCIRVLLKRVDRKTEIQTNNLHTEGSRTLRVVV